MQNETHIIYHSAILIYLKKHFLFQNHKSILIIFVKFQGEDVNLESFGKKKKKKKRGDGEDSNKAQDDNKENGKFGFFLQIHDLKKSKNNNTGFKK